MPLLTRPKEVGEPTKAEGESGGDPATSSGPMDAPTTRAGRPATTKLVIIVLAILIAAIVILFAFFPLASPATPPVDVYSKPSPPEGTQMLSIFPSTVLDNPCTNVKCQNGTGINITTCEYSDGIAIEVRNFSSEWYASSSLDSSRYFWESNSYDVTHYESEGERWFCLSGTDLSIFCWQKGTWVFEVFATDDATRNAVAELLPY